MRRGMITNVATQERVDAISQQTGWSPLTPVSMEGAESLLQTTHLPFYVSEGGRANEKHGEKPINKAGTG